MTQKIDVCSVSQTEDSRSYMLVNAGEETAAGSGLKLRSTEFLSEKHVQLFQENVFYYVFAM